MKSNASTVEEYLENLPENRKEAVINLRNTIRSNIPKGFEETMGYGMIGYVVPHQIYPRGYKTNPKLPLPFVNVASQKNYIALYHMGLYSDSKLLEWFTQEFPKHCKRKLDMGKGCIRFKEPSDIPFKLIGELMTKIVVQDWISRYETMIKK